MDDINEAPYAKFMLHMDNLSDASVRLKILEDKTSKKSEKMVKRMSMLRESLIVQRRGSVQNKELGAFAGA